MLILWSIVLTILDRRMEFKPIEIFCEFFEVNATSECD